MNVRIVTEEELRRCVEMENESLKAVEKSFVNLSKGEATVPLIMMIPVPERTGEVDVKSAYIHGLESFAIKIASGFYKNLQHGLPTSCGLMVIVSAETGFIQVVPLTKLGKIAAGNKHGRESDEQITVCDLTGVGVQDTAIALLAHKKAVYSTLFKMKYADSWN